MPGVWTLLFAALRAGVDESGLAFHFSSGIQSSLAGSPWSE